MGFVDLVFIFLMALAVMWCVARLWLSPAEIGARLGRFAARHRKATITAGVLGGLALLPFVLTGALVLLAAVVLAPAMRGGFPVYYWWPWWPHEWDPYP